MSVGVLMNANEGLYAMGFPICQYDTSAHNGKELLHMLGNTMCVATIGTLCAAMLSAIKHH